MRRGSNPRSRSAPGAVEVMAWRSSFSQLGDVLQIVWFVGKFFFLFCSGKRDVENG